MIKVEDLKKVYGELVAVDGISFACKKGEIVGLLGPNGAGKSTTMRIITCYLPASSGQVTVNGHDAFTEPVEVNKAIGYLPESTPLYTDMKVEEYLDYIGEMRGMSASKRSSRIREVCKMTGLTPRLRQDIGHLSKGYRQRVGLAQALLHDPEVLILDEPTSGLDPNQIVEIREMIKEIGKEKTVILSTHILSEAEATCDRVLIINKGKIVASGTAQELSAQHKETAVIKVTVEGKSKGLEKALAAIDGVTHVLKSDNAVEKGHTIFDVQTVSDKDLRKDVTQAIIQSGFNLVGVSREGKTLEDVFADLTRQ